jgi:hypothetical protein
MVEVITAAVPFFLKLALLYIRSAAHHPSAQTEAARQRQYCNHPCLPTPASPLAVCRPEGQHTAHIILHDAGGPPLPSAKVS